jgi:hypothetical protein
MDKGYMAIIVFDLIFFGGLWLIFKIGEIGELEKDIEYKKKTGNERRPEKKIK